MNLSCPGDTETGASRVNEAASEYRVVSHMGSLGEYKHSDLGPIPNDWESVRVGSLADVRGGKRLPFGFALVDTPTPHPYLRVSDMLPGGVDLSEIRYVPIEAAQAIHRYRISCDDIFISVAGTLGIVGVVPQELDGANLTENADRLTNLKCHRDYLKYWLMSAPIQSAIDSIRTVGAQPKLALGRIADFSIALPSLSREQADIAEALSDVDGLLNALDALIAKKRAIKQAAMQQLLTGKTRLPRFSGEWKKKRLGDHVTFLRNGTNSRADLTTEGHVKYLHYGDIHTSARTQLQPSIDQMPFLPADRAVLLDRLRDGDLVFADASEDIEGVGKAVEIAGATGHEVVSGLHTIAARFDKSVVVNGYKAFLQFCPPFRNHLRRLAAGTKVYAINRAHIASAEIPLPPTPEQHAIAQVLQEMDDEITALERRRDKTRAIKQGMMQQLLTGRVRLVQPSGDADV